MVIEDISAKSQKFSIHNKAPHIDRLFAVIIDFLILSPVIGVFVSGIVGDIRSTILLDSRPVVASLIFQYVFVSMILFIIYESLFGYFLRATPGHYFLYLRIESANEEPLSFNRLLFRAIFKFFSILLMFFPFIEILLKDERNAFYDRISDTKIITLKQGVVNDEVSWQFKSWLLQWLNSIILVWFIVFSIILFQLTSGVGHYEVSENKIEFCSSDLSTYLIIYMQDVASDEKNKNCILKITNREFEKALVEKEQLKSLNYFARHVIADDPKLGAEYLKKFCSIEEKNILCAENSKLNLAAIQDDDLVFYVYTLMKAVKDEQYLNTFLLIDSLYDKLEKSEKLENLYMLSYLKIKENRERKPAATEEVAIDLNYSQFKKRIGVVK